MRAATVELWPGKLMVATRAADPNSAGWTRCWPAIARLMNHCPAGLRLACRRLAELCRTNWFRTDPCRAVRGCFGWVGACVSPMVGNRRRRWAGCSCGLAGVGGRGG